MSRQKIILITSLVIIVLFIVKAYACGCGGGYSGGSSGSFSVPPPIMVPPMPQYQRIWKAKDVVESFEEKGLKVEEQKNIFEGAHDPTIDTAKEAVKFYLPSFGKDIGICIHTFSSKDDLKKVQKHFLDLNDTGELYTWSFVKDNVVLVLTGTIPEDIARQYESALKSL